MAHGTMINGTSYGITGGKCLVGGTVYKIEKGTTLVNGTKREIVFMKETTVSVERSVLSYSDLFINGEQIDFGNVSSDFYERTFEAGIDVYFEFLTESLLYVNGEQIDGFPPEYKSYITGKNCTVRSGNRQVTIEIV